jgi:hypothetical protein
MQKLPDCQAQYTPQFGIGHWSVVCKPVVETPSILASYAKDAKSSGGIEPNELFNPPG